MLLHTFKIKALALPHSSRAPTTSTRKIRGTVTGRYIRTTTLSRLHGKTSVQRQCSTNTENRRSNDGRQDNHAKPRWIHETTVLWTCTEGDRCTRFRKGQRTTERDQADRRWGSDAVERSVQDTPLATSHRITAAVATALRPTREQKPHGPVHAVQDVEEDTASETDNLALPISEEDDMRTAPHPLGDLANASSTPECAKIPENMR